MEDRSIDKQVYDGNCPLIIVTDGELLERLFQINSKEVKAFYLKKGEINMMEKYLPSIQKVEDLPIEEYLAKCKKYEDEVAQGEAKDPAASDRIFDFKARWRKEEIYSEADFGVISDPKKLLKFVSEATTSSRPLHSSCTELPAKKFTERIYG